MDPVGEANQKLDCLEQQLHHPEIMAESPIEKRVRMILSISAMNKESCEPQSVLTMTP
jgi:hypothetical protein